ncbi:helix-turn-helix domain-containing protein [Streptomyces sp. A475]|uniref:helix-turn-helix domain-containing protein n=1 Tax=Streptomyces sp. A475 TaxID=3131976 RepID=UPI0030C8F9E3
MARRPGHRERPLDPLAGLLERFALELRELQERAGLSYVELAQGAHFASSTLSPAAAGQRLHTREVLPAYVRARGGDVGGWEERKIGTWIADFYHTRRRHGAAGGHPPVTFGQDMREAHSTTSITRQCA